MRTSIAILLLLLGGACSGGSTVPNRFTYDAGGIVRGDTTDSSLALVFTGDEFADGGDRIREVLARREVHASFFFTGRFYRTDSFSNVVQSLVSDGHYLGAHSDQHLLYCSWEDRDSLLVSRQQFLADLAANYEEMERFGIRKAEARYFLPPYEWYNGRISAWTAEYGLTLVNFTPGTRSNADYTTPEMGDRYVSSDMIWRSILERDQQSRNGLNGFILLLHIGTAAQRVDKFYNRLDTLIATLEMRGYRFKRIDELLKP